MATSLTPTDILASASTTLSHGGYREVDQSKLLDWPIRASRVFEDPYGLVAVCVFEDWDTLSADWGTCQDALVRLIGRHIGTDEAKAWEGYLVLLTLGRLSESDAFRADVIRYDMTRLRKFLATGEDLKNPEDIRKILMPLLPLTTEDLPPTMDDPLTELPQLLEGDGIDSRFTSAIVDAFRNQASLMDALHTTRARE